MTSCYTFIIIFISFNLIPQSQLYYVLKLFTMFTFPHANIISNVKYVYKTSILHYNCFTPHLLFINPGFILKKTPLAYAIAIFNSSNFSYTFSSCITLNKFPSSNYKTTPPSPMSYPPSITTAKSIHHTGAKVSLHI